MTNYSKEELELIEKKYGKNSRTYKLLMGALDSEDDNDVLVVTGSVNFKPGKDKK